MEEEDSCAVLCSAIPTGPLPYEPSVSGGVHTVSLKGFDRMFANKNGTVLNMPIKLCIYFKNK
jgi:hypothetical protein